MPNPKRLSEIIKADKETWETGVKKTRKDFSPGQFDW